MATLHIKNGNEYIAAFCPIRIAIRMCRRTGCRTLWSRARMKATDKVKELGGQAYMNPTNVDEKLRIAVVADPQGAVFALFQAAGLAAENHG
jgi:hypothetical protein